MHQAIEQENSPSSLGYDPHAVLLTLAEVGQRLGGITPATVRRYVKEGRLNAKRLTTRGRGQFRVVEAVLAEFIAGLEDAGATKA